MKRGISHEGNKLGVYMRNYLMCFGLVLSCQSVALAENVEQLSFGYCRSCNQAIWNDVFPYLPRHDDGSLQQPIDDSTVMDVYRKLWKEANIRVDTCLNTSASMLVNEKVKRASCERRLKRK